MQEIIYLEPGGGLSFGNYVSKEKLKSNDFEVSGDIYKVKTHSEITRVEKNGKLLYESVPGSLVRQFKLSERECNFTISGSSNAQITLELEPEKEYNILISGGSLGASKANSSGKLMFSLELDENQKEINIERI